jgi:purine-binding chemotaxis protein CheW
MKGLMLIANMAGHRVAIPAMDIESVVELEGLTPVPRSASYVAGLSALRSRVLTVIDSSASLDIGRSAAVRHALVADWDGHLYAITVESVEDVVEAGGSVQPVGSPLKGEWGRVTRGMIEVGGELLLVVDVGALIAGPPALAA